MYYESIYNQLYLALPFINIQIVRMYHGCEVCIMFNNIQSCKMFMYDLLFNLCMIIILYDYYLSTSAFYFDRM